MGSKGAPAIQDVVDCGIANGIDGRQARTIARDIERECDALLESLGLAR